MFKSFFQSLMPSQPEIHLRAGFHEEAPIVQQKREQAKQKMKELNRVGILAGGPFSRHTTVLSGAHK